MLSLFEAVCKRLNEAGKGFTAAVLEESDEQGAYFRFGVSQNVEGQMRTISFTDRLLISEIPPSDFQVDVLAGYIETMFGASQ